MSCVLMSGTRRKGRVNGHCLSLERSYDGEPELAFFTVGFVVITKHVARIMIIILRRESIVWNINRRYTYLQTVNNGYDGHVSTGLADVM
jgi:hypothetical protein